jgi:hypothetical protein
MYPLRIGIAGAIAEAEVPLDRDFPDAGEADRLERYRPFDSRDEGEARGDLANVLDDHSEAPSASGATCGGNGAIGA